MTAGSHKIRMGAQLPIAITCSALSQSAATRSRFGAPSNVSNRPVPSGPLMMLPSTHSRVRCCSPATIRSIIAASSRGDSGDNDGCHSNWTPRRSRKSGNVSAAWPGPPAPRIAIDSPLQAPHAIHNSVGRPPSLGEVPTRIPPLPSPTRLRPTPRRGSGPPRTAISRRSGHAEIGSDEAAPAPPTAGPNVSETPTLDLTPWSCRERPSRPRRRIAS